MTTITPLPAVIRRKLSQLRWSVSMWFIADAFGRIAIAVLAMVAASLAIDRYFRMDVPQRGFMLMLMIAVLAYLIIWRLIIPLRQKLENDALCLQIEKAHPELADALVSAVQFSRMTDLTRSGASPMLVNAAIEVGANRARDVNFVDVLDRKARDRSVMRGAGALIVLIAAFVLMPGTMQLWADRNLMLGDGTWPQDTVLTVEGLTEEGILIVPRGDDMELRVNAEGVIPQVVHIDYHIEGRRGRITEQMVGVGESSFRATFRNVLTPFSFRVRGGDFFSPYYQVQLVDRPAVELLELFVTPPAYTQLPRVPLPPGEGAYYVLAGSTLEIHGSIVREIEDTPTRPLADAELRWGTSDVIGPMTIDEDDPHRFAITIAGDDLKTGTYNIAMTNVDGLRAGRPARFNLRVTNDDTPTLRVRLDGIGDLITQRAMVRMNTQIRDDFGITDAALVYEWGSGLDETIEQIEPRRMALPQIADQFGASTIEEFPHVLDVEQLGVPLNAHLTFLFEAVDNDTISGPKTGRSATFSMRVVTEEDLRAELLRRETEQRMEFERLVTDQRNLMVDTQALLAGLGDADRLDTESWRVLSDIERKQRLAAGRCEGIAGSFRQILAEVISNRLEDAGGPLQVRLQLRVIDPLTRLAADGIPIAANTLDEARKVDLTAAQRAARLTAAIDEQAKLIEQMQEILESMVKMEGYQEAINLLRELLRTQQDISEQTRRELEKRIEDIFDNE